MFMHKKIDLNNLQKATSETARNINRRNMLNLVRNHQPLSQADLMRKSGLQRSTVSVITKQLILERWLREGAIVSTSRGRRPTLLHLNEDRVGIFGVNIQPEVTDIALANFGGRFLVQESISTPSTPEEFVNRVSQRIWDIREEYPKMTYEEIGVSLPGRIDLASQRFVFAPNLAWPETNIKIQLEDATGLSVSLENAANACALSEFWFGKHSEQLQNLIVITVSEGIGVGMILNGQLVRGSSGLAGEFGHVTINEKGPKCACGNYGCWEVYASNSAAVRHYNEAKSLLRKRIKGHNHLEARTFGDLLHLVEQRDPLACKSLDRMALYLGKGLAMLVAGLAPEVIVVVGDVARAWDRIRPIVTSLVKERVSTHSPIKIIASGLTPQPRLRGIIALVLQKYFGMPTAAEFH
jgi:predicted NBD/HSP70 family sugar kinase